MVELFPSLSVGSTDTQRTDRTLMANSRRKWLAFGRRIGNGTLFAIALAIPLAGASLAQDAGVSGIPQGPGNINGVNGSVRDPSGVGNAGKVAPLPEPNIGPVTPPAVAPVYSTGPLVRRGPARVGLVRPQWSRLPPRARRAVEEAAVKENDRLLKHGVTSICRGC
jgi:hypothetical protein